MAFKIKNKNDTTRGDTPQGKVIDAEGLEIQQFNLKAHAEQPEQENQAFDEVLKAARNTKKKKRRSRKTILTEEAKDRAMKGTITEVACFILVAGPIAFFLYSQHHTANANSMELYLDFRLYVIPAAWLLIAYEGWKNTNLAGILCAILPPYWLYFLIAEVDNRAMRGTVSALVLILALETFWVPDVAWMTGKQAQFNQIVSKVHTLISRPPEIQAR